MNPKTYFDAAMEISSLVNAIISLVSQGADEEIAQGHFESISRIAAENAAKPEIQGNSEHE